MSFDYELDLVDAVHTRLPWPEKRDLLCSKVESSLWLYDVIRAASEEYWPFKAPEDCEFPGEEELTRTGFVLERLRKAPDENAWFVALDDAQDLLVHDRVHVRHGRWLQLV